MYISQTWTLFTFNDVFDDIDDDGVNDEDLSKWPLDVRRILESPHHVVQSPTTPSIFHVEVTLT